MSEAEAYRAAGFSFEWLRDHPRPGLVSYRVAVEVNHRIRTLFVQYPEGFPYVKPTVVAPYERLPLHQHPVDHTLCLISTQRDTWTRDMTGAFLVRQAARLIADFEEGPEVVAAHDVGVPEPIAYYFGETNGEACLVDPGIRDAQYNPGEVTKLAAQVLAANGDSGIPYRVYIQTFPEQRDTRSPLMVPHVHLAVPPSPALGPVELWESVVDESLGERLRGYPPMPEPLKRHLVVTFPDEGPKRGEWHNGVVYLRADHLTRPKEVHLAKAFFLDPEDIFTRNPRLQPLADKSVLVVGLGSVGSRLSEILTRAGVRKFLLVDQEQVEAANLARHVATFEDVGLKKAHALGLGLRRVSPRVQVVPLTMRLGSTNGSVGFLEEHAGKADIVICAVGDTSLHLLVDRVARRAGATVVHTWITNGAWGGEVMVTSPERACLACHLAATTPEPPASPDAEVWAAGCGFPSFTGALHDIELVVSHAAQRVIDLLLDGKTDPNHAVISTGANGELPRFEACDVARAANCPDCAG